MIVMVYFLDRDRRSNSVLPSRFGQGIKPPRQPNFAHNMHPNKRCSRSLAHPNRTTPEYHDVDHGVVVGRPRRFCVIAPIVFVGGMGGWCCRTWCAVVFVVVLRSCAGNFFVPCVPVQCTRELCIVPLTLFYTVVTLLHLHYFTR